MDVAPCSVYSELYRKLSVLVAFGTCVCVQMIGTNNDVKAPDSNSSQGAYEANYMVRSCSTLHNVLLVPLHILVPCVTYRQGICSFRKRKVAVAVVAHTPS
jgi:hypothetical protein